MLSVHDFAKHFDAAFLNPSLTEEEVRGFAREAREADLACFYANTVWTPVVADVLAGSDVRIGAACAFPLGAVSIAMKDYELKEAVQNGATALDLVSNTGAIRAGEWDLIDREIKTLKDAAQDGILSKMIIETAYLDDAQLAQMVQRCSAGGIDYVKSGTNTQPKSEDYRVRIMLDNVSGHTQVKVSALPDTFMMSAVLHMIDEGVKLFGTMHAVKCVHEYESYLAWKSAR